MVEMPEKYTDWLYQREKDLCTLPYMKNYGDKFYRMIVLKRIIDYDTRTYIRKGTVNEHKLENNLIRAKGRVLELGLCNDWDWFVTLTLDAKKYDRYNLKKYIKDLGQFIRDSKKKYGCDIKYALVPEQHEDGAWHLHGFLMGLPESEIQPTGYYGKDGTPYVHWSGYARKFGYMSMSAVKDSIGCAIYMRKYITKSMAETNAELGCHTYYASQKLKGCGDTIPLHFNAIADERTWKLAYIGEFADLYTLEPDVAQDYLKKYSWEVFEND